MPVVVVANVVLAMADTVGAEDVVQFGAAVWLREGPVLDDGEHLAVEFAVRVSISWVVEDAHNVVEDLVHWDVRMFPSVENAWGYVFEDCGSYFASRFVEDVGKVVFGKEGVRGICAVRVGPGLVLMLSRRVDYRGTASFELHRNSVDDWSNEGREERHDEERDCFGYLLNEGFETGDFLDCGIY